MVNSQLDALRVENRHLRQTARQTGNTDRDLKLADAQLHDLQNAYAISIQTLEVFMLHAVWNSVRLNHVWYQLKFY